MAHDDVIITKIWFFPNAIIYLLFTECYSSISSQQHRISRKTIISRKKPQHLNILKPYSLSLPYFFGNVFESVPNSASGMCEWNVLRVTVVP